MQSPTMPVAPAQRTVLPSMTGVPLPRQIADTRCSLGAQLAVSPVASNGRRFATAPGGPGGPAVPASPLGPVTPRGPASPIAPAGPGGPGTPASPRSPLSPLSPFGPAGP